MSKSLATTSTARLNQDFIRLQRDPVPYVTAAPLPSNILTWYYIVRGPENTPYFGGIYMGKLVFPKEFPFKPPSIYMLTPNGRFKTNQKLCLSISDFHPDTWNPAWSVSTILTGLLSFMVENTPTSGSTESTDVTKRRLAYESLEYNLNDKIFCDLFPDVVEEIKEIINERTNESVNSNTNNSNNTTNPTNTNRNRSELEQQLDNNNLRKLIGNLIFIACIAAFGVAVKYVLNSIN